ncbi:multiprotein-bridging factor 1 family protein [Methylobacterium sp. J-070]|uniref:helix-turn-helix domain-containing protein n=1 Tax=Methylobacterium sp. J-070 TaxID=2836650 RepID=UPI001FBB04DE|nr:helix-turn-helix transcriptional regulator [Methylobacterium sp. J-070]MCJ2048385.1 helix-turn-helix domain-containing protein [Methylobacterium sp. J-070]
MFAPALSRAARGLIDWSQSDLAAASGVSLSTVRDFETGKRTPIANNLAALQRALEGAGVEFTSGGEPGVKLRRKDPA